MGTAINLVRTRYHRLVHASLARCQLHIPTRLTAYLGLLGTSIAIFGVAVLMVAGYLKLQAVSAGLFTNFVSSLGWGANGSHEVFKFGLTSLAALLIIFMLLLITELRRQVPASVSEDIHELTHHSAGAWYIAAAGMCLLAWFVDIRVPEPGTALTILMLHILGAALFFTYSVLGAVKLTRAMTLHGIASRFQYWLMRSAVFNTVAMGVSILPLMIVSYKAGLLDGIFPAAPEFFAQPEQRVSWISRVTANYPWISFFEWAAVLSMLGWTGVTAIQMHRAPVQAKA